MIRTKDDIEFHSDYGRQSRPAVNVKVRKTLPQGYNAWIIDYPDYDKRFTLEWIEKNYPDEDGMIFNMSCEMRWEDLESAAQEIWGRHTKVYSEGRQGGWAVVDKFNSESVEEWDAIDLARWRRFAKYARVCADGIMYDCVDFIYHNYFDDWADEESERAAPDIPEGYLTNRITCATLR